MFAQPGVSGQAHKGMRPAEVAGAAPGAALANGENHGMYQRPAMTFREVTGRVQRPPGSLDPGKRSWS